ncbi:unnamed protein product [Arctia plantaginis]|uniref:Uncharacterized protein n=1 Tax=Arctia plantaginis TaxID=874455 RepID=A0A8S1A6M4_ARCPL|nr:unnamed protein product [Arctia plantaginis]
MKKEKKFCRSQHTSLKKSSLSYSLCHQLSASESPVEIGPAVPEITRNKQRDRQKFKKMLFWHMYHVNIHMHLTSGDYVIMALSKVMKKQKRNKKKKIMREA